ncbi:MAG: dehydrogenase, partial [Acidobacteria bacterium]
MLRPRLVVAIAALGIAGALVWFWIAPARRRGREAPRQPPPPADVFKADVRPTPPRTPEEERSGFQLPPGFEIELFASEPDIGKPLNMAFDSRGRLWITQSREYPHAAADGKGGDKVLILEDSDGDGRADKFIPFAEGLNIPVGVVPVRGGAVVYSIPYIYRFFDLDGDGRADDRAVLYGKFAYDDTHGMVSHFRRGFDGWIYACHGFTNKSTVSGRDGNTVVMDSGNTFRFRLDGSRIEHFTHGQVNPFGLAFDPLGNLYSADCHSQPIYQLLEDADYPHFARPATGIGFGPAMMDHDHGSTAIAGIAYYAAEQFPEEYRGNIFTGNVVTSRINRDSLEARGSTPFAVAEVDFVISQDPWFRPVDLQLAPDGSLYVADFYNRIIGHVEVPLDHPGRDKLRGRIWRIRYRGPGAGARSSGRVRLAGARIEALLAALGDPNLKVRMLAADELVDRVGRTAVEPVRRLVESRAAKPTQKSHGLWVLARLRALEPSLLAAATADPDATVRVHAFRILAQEAAWKDSERALALAGLADHDPRVERAAAGAARLHPDASQVRPLVDLRARIPPADTHLLHATRLALRDQLRSPGVLESAARERWP